MCRVNQLQARACNYVCRNGCVRLWYPSLWWDEFRWSAILCNPYLVVYFVCLYLPYILLIPMKSFLLVLSLGAFRTVLPFVDLGSSGLNFTGVLDGATPAIFLPSRLRFGASTETIAYVSWYYENILIMNHFEHFLSIPQISTNGLISFGSAYTHYIPSRFPITQRVIAPYWHDIDMRFKGSVMYATITSTHPTLSHLLDVVSNFVSDAENIQFVATMMLVARWVDACPYPDSFCTNVSKWWHTMHMCTNN